MEKLRRRLALFAAGIVVFYMRTTLGRHDFGEYRQMYAIEETCRTGMDELEPTRSGCTHRSPHFHIPVHAPTTDSSRVEQAVVRDKS